MNKLMPWVLVIAAAACSGSHDDTSSSGAEQGGGGGAAGAGGGTGGEAGSAGGGAGGSAGGDSTTTASVHCDDAGDPTSSTYNDLCIPGTISGTSFDLDLAPSSKQLQSGAKTSTLGYNGASFWGPTLLMNKGDTVQLNVKNGTSSDTTTHWHGIHLPAVMDGGPHQIIAAGATWSPSFEVKNHAATFWYHPHLHTTTQAQLTLGAGGFIIVRDAEEAALALPRTYGVDDIPVVFTSRRFDASNQFTVTNTAYGDYLLANGTIRPQASLPAQLVRLRLLNAEVERAYDLGFSDGRTFHAIGTDGGLLNAPVAVTRLKLYPGERAEIVVDLSADAVGSSVDLQAFNGNETFGFPGAEPGTSGEFGSLLNATTFTMLHVRVAAATADGVHTLPTSLATNTYWTEADVTNSRSVAITDNGPGTPFTFDNAGYDANTINQTVALDAVEKWTIPNSQTFDHAFHIHDVQFKVVSRTDGAIPAYEQGWKDTVHVPRGGSVTFIAKFDDFASATNPFMYHCHMSNHEDEGLMGQFLVK